MLEANQVEDLLTKAAAKSNLRHVVYVSSVGAEKAGFQFTLVSLGGSLEKKKAVLAERQEEVEGRRQEKWFAIGETILKMTGFLGRRRRARIGPVLADAKLHDIPSQAAAAAARARSAPASAAPASPTPISLPRPPTESLPSRVTGSPNVPRSWRSTDPAMCGRAAWVGRCRASRYPSRPTARYSSATSR